MLLGTAGALADVHGPTSVGCILRDPMLPRTADTDAAAVVKEAVPAESSLQLGRQAAHAELMYHLYVAENTTPPAVGGGWTHLYLRSLGPPPPPAPAPAPAVDNRLALPPVHISSKPAKPACRQPAAASGRLPLLLRHG